MNRDGGECRGNMTDCLSATPSGKPERLEETVVSIGIIYSGHKVRKQSNREVCLQHTLLQGKL